MVYLNKLFHFKSQGFSISLAITFFIQSLDIENPDLLILKKAATA